MENHKKGRYSGIFICALAVFYIGWTAHKIFHKDNLQDTSYTQIRENSPSYNYINPFLYLDNSNINFHHLDPLEEKLVEYVSEAKINGRANRISIYFRDLNTSMWTGVDEDELYLPSSMFKILPLITYLKLAEEDLGIFDKKFPYKRTESEAHKYPPEQKLENGMFDLRILLGQSIIYSDNDAHDALTPPIEKELGNFYKIMQMPPLPARLDNYFSPRAMSTIFRALYNASYLPESYSEQALELLTKTKFDKGLVAGVRAGIPVAHKFGEYTSPLSASLTAPVRQLHDCGIIYHSLKPYFLCVMTEGREFEGLERVISDISKITFSFVDGS